MNAHNKYSCWLLTCILGPALISILFGEVSVSVHFLLASQLTGDKQNPFEIISDQMIKIRFGFFLQLNLGKTIPLLQLPRA